MSTATWPDRGSLVERFLELQPVLGRRLGACLTPELREELGSVTIHQLQVVKHLGPGPLTMRELSRDLDVSESATTAAADRLVRQGLAERRADPTDRRVVRLALSERGRSFTEKFHQARRGQVEKAFEVLSDAQVGAFVDVLETLAADPAGPAETAIAR
ncbi:MAG: hypothetical protein DLM54_07810 [Acidimicrobiales bacterium]|nr:MAG: hypothetical protein DLM54_07810 [Acidimicrobiales bacterium]